MRSAVPGTSPSVLRQRLLGSEASYRVLDESDGVVTAEVLSAPGLPAGMRIRLMADALRSMERLDQPIRVTRRRSHGPIGARRPALHIG